MDADVAAAAKRSNAHATRALDVLEAVMACGDCLAVLPERLMEEWLAHLSPFATRWLGDAASRALHHEATPAGY